MASGSMSSTKIEVSREVIREQVFSYLCKHRTRLGLPQPTRALDAARDWAERTSNTGKHLNELVNDVYEQLRSSDRMRSTVIRVNSSTEMHAYNAYYPTQVKFLILEEMRELIRAGILIETKFILERPGQAYDFKFDLGKGWVVLSEYGEQCIRENRILPHDPQEYLADLGTRCGVLDPEASVLVRESLLTFQAHCFVASVILIGAASERLIQVLFESYRDAYRDQADRDRLDQEWERERSSARRFVWLWQKLDGRRNELNIADRLWDGAEGLVRATFDALRTARNEAVHQNRRFDRIQANEFLFLFVPYAERVCALVNYFGHVAY